MDLLMKKLEASTNMETTKIMDAHMTCEVCGNVGHSGNDCLETREEGNFINNGNNNSFHNNFNNQGWTSRPNFPFNNQNGGNYSNSFNNQPSIKDLVFGQARINESLNRNLAANEKVLKNLNSTIESYTSAMKNQLSFNKMVETQLAQLAASLLSSESDGIPGQPEPTRENLKSVTTRGGKTTRDPPHPNPAEKKQKEVTTKSDEEVDTKEASPGEECLRKTTPQEYVDTTLLPFPRRIKKPTVDEQFGKFVEVIKKLNVNIPFLEAMQVPTYAKYLKDILKNKTPLPTTDMVKLTEECSAAILKKKDLGCPTINCSIGSEHFENALCDLGASISVMPKVVFDKLNYTSLSPTTMCLQLADQLVRYPAGIAEDIPARVQDFFVPVDFVVLNMDVDTRTPLILGRPFLSIVNANIDVGAGEIRLNINSEEEPFTFKSKVEQCSQVRMVDRKISNLLQEGEVAPTKPKVKSFNGRHQPKKSKTINKAKREKKTEIKNTPAKASPTSSHQRNQRRCGELRGASSEPSTSGSDEPKIN
jgi:hypothetical protein